MLHINEKELRAAVATIKALGRPGQSIILHVDNQVAFSYLTKWGEGKEYLNRLLKPLLYWCQEQKISLLFGFDQEIFSFQKMGVSF